MDKWRTKQDQDALLGIKKIRIAVNYQATGLGCVLLVAKSRKDGVQYNKRTFLQTRRALFDIERHAASIIIKGGCDLDHESKVALQDKLADLMVDKKMVTAHDLFEVAKLLQGYSCMEQLNLQARDEECLTADNENFYLAYKDWKVNAKATIGEKKAQGHAAEAEGMTEAMDA
jgi:hypothetical protein